MSVDGLRRQLEAQAAFTAHTPAYLRALRFVLEHGEPFEAARPPARYRPQRPLAHRGLCFAAAGELALAHPGELAYCEGFGGDLNRGYHHAWAVTRAGVVVDVAWGELAVKRGWSYLGVRLPPDPAGQPRLTAG